jgi:hypothetical protein
MAERAKHIIQASVVVIKGSSANPGNISYVHALITRQDEQSTQAKFYHFGSLCWWLTKEQYTDWSQARLAGSKEPAPKTFLTPAEQVEAVFDLAAVVAARSVLYSDNVDPALQAKLPEFLESLQPTAGV